MDAERKAVILKAVSNRVRDGYAVVSNDGFAYQAVGGNQNAWVTNDGGFLNVSLGDILIDYAVGAREFEVCVDNYFDVAEEFARIVTARISDIVWD